MRNNIRENNDMKVKLYFFLPNEEKLLEHEILKFCRAVLIISRLHHHLYYLKEINFLSESLL